MQNNLLSILIFLFFFGLSYSGYSQKYPKATEKELANIFQEMNRDKILLTEYLAAKEFHHIINEYRIAKKRDTLQWSDIIWLAARNHSIYIANANFSHSESSTRPYYTGRDPEARLSFVQNINLKYIDAGENIVMSYFEEDSKKIAQEIAKEAFDIWQHSSGHNQNMLASDYRFHGTSFIIKGEQFFGTDLFVETNIYKDPTSHYSSLIDEIDLALENEKEVPVKLLTEALNMELKRRIYNGYYLINFNNDYRLAANEHAAYLLLNNETSHLQKPKNIRFYAKTPEARVNKAKFGFWRIFRAKPKGLKEFIVQYTVKEQSLDYNKLMDHLWENLVMNNHIQLKNYLTVGSSIISARLKNGELKFIGVILIKP